MKNGKQLLAEAYDAVRSRVNLAELSYLANQMNSWLDSDGEWYNDRKNDTPSNIAGIFIHHIHDTITGPLTKELVNTIMSHLESRVDDKAVLRELRKRLNKDVGSAHPASADIEYSHRQQFTGWVVYTGYGENSINSRRPKYLLYANDIEEAMAKMHRLFMRFDGGADMGEFVSAPVVTGPNCGYFDAGEEDVIAVFSGYATRPPSQSVIDQCVGE